MPVASAALATQVDGILYANAKLIPAAEGDLSTLVAPVRSPLFVGRNSNATAVVSLARQGNIASVTAYVVLQTQIGGEDAPWIDVAWCGISTIPSPSAPFVFLLASSQFGPNAFAQRVSGTAPATTLGSNAMGLGGRIRFVGKATAPAGTSSSSSASGSPTPTFINGILATIRVKLQGMS